MHRSVLAVLNLVNVSNGSLNGGKDMEPDCFDCQRLYKAGCHLRTGGNPVLFMSSDNNTQR